jgi:uncharacterized protein involved in exopolysaccharide biosynthesis
MEKENEIDVVSLFWIIWDQKFLVLAISLLLGVIAAIYALTATPIYRAQVVVTEVQENGMGSLGSLMGQLGGLASVAGLNLNGNGGADAERPAILQSRGLVDEFIRRYKLAPVINGNSKLGSDWFAVERFRQSVLDRHEDKLKGTTTVSVEWKDPVIAARWANDFVGVANDLLRDRAIQESTRNIDFLEKQLAKTTVVEIQQAIYQLIEHETKSLMLAHGRAEYAFSIVDPAVPPEVRFSPRRTLLVLSGIIVGGLMGSFIAWARKAVRRRRPPTATD